MGRRVSNGSSWSVDAVDHMANGTTWSQSSNVVPSISTINYAAASSTFAGALNVSLGTDKQTGDVAYGFVTTRNNQIPTGPSGWTEVRSATSGGIANKIVRRVFDGSEGANAQFTTSGTGQPWHCSILILRGVDTSSPEETFSGAFATASSFTRGPINMTRANSLLIFSLGYSAASARTTTFPSSMTVLSGNGGTVNNGVAIQTIPYIGGSNQQTLTMNTSTLANAVLFGVKIAP